MEDANTVRVLWNRLTGVDAEHVVSYSVTYRFDDNGEELVALFPADVSYGRISGLVSGEEYLFRVSAIADIEGDTIEGDKSETDIDSFHPVPATVPPGMVYCTARYSILYCFYTLSTMERVQ